MTKVELINALRQGGAQSGYSNPKVSKFVLWVKVMYDWCLNEGEIEAGSFFASEE